MSHVVPQRGEGIWRERERGYLKVTVTNISETHTEIEP